MKHSVRNVLSDELSNSSSAKFVALVCQCMISTSNLDVGKYFESEFFHHFAILDIDTVENFYLGTS